MSAIRKTSSRGFTLVEILIVVIILGILAAIVIPQFTNASQNARESSLQSTLQTLRSQVELYKLQHGDTLPNLVTDWTPLTTPSTYPAVGGTTFGPYMQAIPINPLNSLSTVSDSSANLSGVTTQANLTADIKTPGSGVGFVYDYESGAGSGLIYGTDSTGKAVAGPSGSTSAF
jgi:general secretion pathway protein G